MAALSLLNELKSGGYECSLITTFNTFFPFYEDIVLSHLINKGVYYNILLADQAQCMVAIKQAPPRLNGKSYTLLPIPTNCFHPKVFLLLGKRKGFLAVGSHNMTLSGFGYNGELTNVVRFELDKHEEHLPVFWQAWQSIVDWIETLCVDFPQELTETINKCLSFSPWLVQSAPSPESRVQFLASSPSKRSLWNQSQGFLPDKIERVTVIGAFFDEKLSFIKQMQNSVTPAECIIGIQPNTVSVPQSILKENIKVVNSSILKTGTGTGYLHAKAILFESTNNNILISGSANPSAPAWLQSGKDGNIEAILLRQLTGDEDDVNELGLFELHKELPLTELPLRRAPEINSVKESLRLILAVAKDKETSFYFDVPTDLSAINFTARLFNNGKGYIGEYPVSALDKKRRCIKPDAAHYKHSHHIELYSEGRAVIQLMLHFESAISSRSLSGWARDFQKSLGSLGTQDPDIKFVFECIEKIIFSQDDEGLSSHKTGPKGNESKEQQGAAGKPLSVGLDDLTAQGKQAGGEGLEKDTDIETFIKILLRELDGSNEQDKVIPGEDKLGRNEEDQVDSDDEEIQQSADVLERNAVALERFDRKIASFIKRISKWVSGSTSEENFSQERLVAVAMFLHLLNRSKNKFEWATNRENLISSELLRLLFIAICESRLESIFAAELTLLNERKRDGIARLKGFVFWLAYSTSIIFTPAPVFSETTKDARERNWKSATYIYLAQQLAQSDNCYDLSANMLSHEGTPKPLIWLDLMREKGKQILELQAHISSGVRTTSAAKGEIAFHISQAFPGTRVR